MKANKALRRLTKIEPLMSDVTERYVTTGGFHNVATCMNSSADSSGLGVY